MKALAHNNILNEPGFEYRQQIWGDLIFGTKEQLQRIGIGVGVAFPPTNMDGRKRLNTIDPRGFLAKVTHRSGDGYCASISFPGRKFDDESEPRPFAPGVTARECPWWNAYTGTAEALVAAGLVPPGYFPGWPGMRKTIVTILPDGTLPKGGPTANCIEAKKPGAKQVTVKSRGQKITYLVTIYLSADEADRRQKLRKIALLEWEARMNALPRPAPLVDLPSGIVGGRAVKVKPAPKYRTEGNVIHLAPRSEWRAA